MVLLQPDNFKKLPLGYRPQKSVNVSKNFANKVKRVKRNGPRADDENIADVVTVVENMRTYTPQIFKRNNKTKNKNKSKKNRSIKTRRNTYK